MPLYQAIVGLWRWRDNPLYRRSDRVEGWLALCAALLILLAAPVAGWAGGTLAYDELRQTVREQFRQRHRVWATADRIVPLPPVAPDPDAPTERNGKVRVVAVWRGADGGTRTGTVEVAADAGVGPGDRVPLWVDRRGRPVSRPLTEETAASRALLVGLAAGGGTVGLVETARRLALWRLRQLRAAALEREWLRLGPDPGRAGAGS